MNVYTVTIAVSIIVYIAIGGYAGRGIKRLDDYYVAGRQAPTLLIVGTLVASLLSTGVFMGDAAFVYAGQLGAYVLLPGSLCAGYVLGAILFGRYLRRSRATTVAEFLGKRFASRRLQALAGYTIIFGLGVYLLTVTQGAGILLSELSALSYWQAMIVAWLSYSAFTMYSGSRGVVLTDTLMFLLFLVASIAATVFVLDYFGGPAATVEQLVALEEKRGLLSWHGIIGPGTTWPTATDFLIWFLAIELGWMLVYAASPWQASRHLMARNEHVVLRSALIAGFIALFLMIVIYVMAGAINLANADIHPKDRAVVWAALNLLPPFLGALLLAGITAAALSSASTFLSLVGFSASNDIGVHKNADEASALRFSRSMMLATGFVVLVAGMIFPPDIFGLLIFIGTVFGSTWGPVAIMSIWSKKMTEAAAFWGMLAGALFNIVPSMFVTIGMITLPSYFHPAFIGTAASLIVIVLVSRHTHVTEAEAAYRAKLHEIPPEEIDTGKTRTTLWAAAMLIVITGIIQPWLLIAYYVRPLQAATGTLLPDGSFNWFTGEALAVLTCCVVYPSIGLIAAWVIRRDYSPKKVNQALSSLPEA